MSPSPQYETALDSKPFFKSISLLNYRNFNSLKLEFNEGINVLYGSNGVGKTNIIEALSLFAPGRGLRNAKPEHLLTNFNTSLSALGWSVKSNLTLNDLNKEIITYKNSETSKRVISINGEKLSSQAKIANLINLIWLTPEHDNIFNDSASVRRKFFDRIVTNFFPDHNQNIFRYEHYLRERMHVLRNNPNASSWLDNIEASLAELATSIAYSRITVSAYLNESLLKFDQKYPAIRLDINGEFENLIKENNNADLISYATSAFAKNRNLDKESNKTLRGVHKSDLDAIYLKNNLSGKYCSTGEQKTIIFAITLSYALCLKKISNRSPIIFLDEVISHLDNQNIKKILHEILNMDSQIFITTTEKKNIPSTQQINYLNVTDLTPL